MAGLLIEARSPSIMGEPEKVSGIEIDA